MDNMEGMLDPHTQLVVGAGGNSGDKQFLGACLKDKGLFQSPLSKEQSPGHQK